jgi:hypothetical protein
MPECAPVVGRGRTGCDVQPVAAPSLNVGQGAVPC